MLWRRFAILVGVFVFVSLTWLNLTSLDPNHKLGIPRGVRPSNEQHRRKQAERYRTLESLNVEGAHWGMTKMDVITTFRTKSFSSTITKNYSTLGLLIPTTSKFTNFSSVRETALLRHSLPTMRETLLADMDIRYVMAVAVDDDDPLYMRADQTDQLVETVRKELEGIRVEFQLYKFSGVTPGNLSSYYNVLAKVLYTVDQCDYFFQCSDDTRFLTPRWPEHLINTLRSNPVQENFGVTGMREIKRLEELKGTLYNFFIHQTHLDIFGYFFHGCFLNWGQTVHLTKVYDTCSSAFLLDHVQIENVINPGSVEFSFHRYRVDLSYRQRFFYRVRLDQTFLRHSLPSKTLERCLPLWTMEFTWKDSVTEAEREEWLRYHKPSSTLRNLGDLPQRCLRGFQTRIVQIPRQKIAYLAYIPPTLCEFDHHDSRTLVSIVLAWDNFSATTEASQELIALQEKAILRNPWSVFLILPSQETAHVSALLDDVSSFLLRSLGLVTDRNRILAFGIGDGAEAALESGRVLCNTPHTSPWKYRLLALVSAKNKTYHSPCDRVLLRQSAAVEGLTLARFFDAIYSLLPPVKIADMNPRWDCSMNV